MKGGIILLFCLGLALHSIAQLLPPGSVVEGRTVGEWTAEWWKWLVPIPGDRSPHADTTGAYVNEQQPANTCLFFLGGVSGSDLDHAIVTRTFSIPEAKYLLVPLLVYEADNINAVPPLTVPEMREQASASIHPAGSLFITLDGAALTHSDGGEVANLFDHGEISPVFGYDLRSPDNFMSLSYGVPIQGFIWPAVAEGYWVVAEPLSVGNHVLHYGGLYPNPGWYPYDVTANVTVVSSPPLEHLRALRCRVETAGLPLREQRLLQRRINAGFRAVERHRECAAVSVLGAFKRRVERMAGGSDTTLRMSAAAQTAVERIQDGCTRGRRAR